MRHRQTLAQSRDPAYYQSVMERCTKRYDSR